MKLRIMGRVLPGIAATVFTLAQPVAAQQVYVASETNIFGVLDFALNQPNSTNQVNVIGTLTGLASGDNLLGMGYGTDGNIYAVDNQGNYYQLNPHTAALTTIGNPIQTQTGSVLEAVSDNHGTMYVVDSNYDLYKVDMTQPFSHSATLLGVIAPGNTNSLTPPMLDGYIALDSQGHLYVGATPDLNANPNGHDGLYLVTPNASGGVTTTAVNNGTTNTGFDQLTGGVTVNNTLYGFGGPSTGSYFNVVSLSTVTGAGTILGQYGWPQSVNGQYIYASLVAASVPEASSFTLLSSILGAAAGGLLLCRKRAITV